MKTSRIRYKHIPAYKAPVIYSGRKAAFSLFRFYGAPVVFLMAAATCAMMIWTSPREASARHVEISSVSQETKVLNENIRLLATSVETLRDGITVLKKGLDESRLETQNRHALLDQKLSEAKDNEQSATVMLKQVNDKFARLEQTEAVNSDLIKRLAALEEKVSQLQAKNTDDQSSLAPVAQMLPPQRPQNFASNRAPSPSAQWRVLGVDGGYAVIEGAQGLMEVRVGNIIPGVGRVDAVTQRGREWVVVTRQGLIRSYGNSYQAGRQPSSTWSRQGR